MRHFLATFSGPRTRITWVRGLGTPQGAAVALGLAAGGLVLPGHGAAADNEAEAQANALTNPQSAVSRPGQRFSLAPVVAEVIAGVVNIRTTDAATGLRSPIPGQMDPDKLFSMMLGTRSADDKLSATSRSMGSGFFVKDTGTIVTNHHVIKDAASIVIYATELQVYRKASIIGTDERMDIALLRVTSVPGAKALELASSGSVRPGDTVFAIGNPFGYGNSVSSGILSAKGRAVGSGSLAHLLQTDVPLNPGNSGGPLFDLEGKVIGINTANVVAAQGISFAIPAEMAANRVDALRTSGNKRGAQLRPWIGLVADNLYDDPQFSGDSYGILVRSVIRNSPAERAGILRGDVIQKAAGQRLTHTGQLEAVLAEQRAGKRMLLAIYRQGKSMTVEIELKTPPQALARSKDTLIF